jgi:hypothetical protein
VHNHTRFRNTRWLITRGLGFGFDQVFATIEL